MSDVSRSGEEISRNPYNKQQAFGRGKCSNVGNYWEIVFYLRKTPTKASKSI
jgi:hypothetical protein